ncbi:hypothetical protein GA0070624_2225 [Micromonospora rhizosphaerae]|uniref:Acetyltransferase (GNAT) domain-containing protein n=1 Tax=Micromonospora rhizosphaerae TaxID=568872 RepID=A0A1C6RVE8_9ACTN|nr:GNAT family N-acetyltransferase [Micromonospora rhizosphaerae]SCL21104.1 hypothetical protein GA0070624_2225 [Micromonospora rhizosphaerae]
MSVDHQAPGFSVKPTLTGGRVVLRPFVDDDLAAFEVALADPEVARLTGSPPDGGFDTERLRAWYGSRGRHRHVDPRPGVGGAPRPPAGCPDAVIEMLLRGLWAG